MRAHLCGKAIRCCAALSCLFLFVSTARATGEDRKEYRVTHFFNLTPGGNVQPIVTANYFEHAWVLDPALRFSVVPVPQPPGFNNGGFENTDRMGRVNNFNPNGTPNGPANTASVAVPAGGFPFPPGFVSSAIVAPPVNEAQANSRIGVNPVGPGGAVSGAIQADGFAVARKGPNPSRAYAFSYAQVTAQGGVQLKNGQIRWRPQISTPPVAGGAGAGAGNIRRVRDPVFFHVSDGANTLDGTLLEIDMDLPLSGGVAWDATTGSFAVDTPELILHMDVSDPHTAQQGLLDLVIQNNIITTSNDSGIFNGILPPSGGDGSFLMNIPEIVLDYDLGSLGPNAQVTIGFAGSGDAFAEVVPEPASLGATAVIGLVLVRRRR